MKTFTLDEIHEVMHNLDSDLRYRPETEDHWDYTELHVASEVPQNVTKEWYAFLTAYRRLHEAIHDEETEND